MIHHGMLVKNRMAIFSKKKKKKKKWAQMLFIKLKIFLETTLLHTTAQLANIKLSLGFNIYVSTTSQRSMEKWRYSSTVLNLSIRWR
jgi:hypothetical protein